MRSSKLLLLATSFALTACASAPQGSDGVSNKITAVQIATADVPTAYEAVDRLHRSWFRDPLHPDASVKVYLSTNQLLGDGSKEALRDVPASDVVLLEYMKGDDAIVRFGQDALGGVIIVTRK